MKNSSISRRTLLVNSGGIAAAGAVLAACGSTDAGLARVGEAPATTALPSASITDNVLLRTLQSVELLAISALQDSKIGGKGDAKLKSAIAIFVKGHQANLADLETLLSARGGTSVTEPNEKLMKNYVAKAAELIPDSDEPETDAMVFVHALEGMVGASYQAYVAWANDPALRSAMMKLAVRPSAYSATTAQMIRGGSKGIVPGTDEAGAPLVATLPTAFGSLAAFSATIGKPNDTGARLQLNLETPSLNSLQY